MLLVAGPGPDFESFGAGPERGLSTFLHVVSSRLFDADVMKTDSAENGTGIFTHPLKYKQCNVINIARNIDDDDDDDVLL